MKMEPFKARYASFDGGDNTAFIPMAVTKDDPPGKAPPSRGRSVFKKKKDDSNKYLCCFPEEYSDEGQSLIKVKTHLGHIEKVTFGVEDFSEVSGKGIPRMGSIMFEYHIHSQNSNFLCACEVE